MRDCNKCIWATRDGGCVSWDCNFVDMNEAYRAWQESRWIPCSERLPEQGQDILVCDIDGNIYLTHLPRSDGSMFYDSWGNKIKNITAWMPLPECYREGERE